jgi:uncharacterized protein YlaI
MQLTNDILLTNIGLNTLNHSTNTIDFYRACAFMNRASVYGMYKNNPVFPINLEKCSYCDFVFELDKYNNIIFYYVNSPLLEYILCEECGSHENIPITNNEDTFVHKYKLKYEKKDISKQ